MNKITRGDVLRIAAEAMADPRTVARIYEGKKSIALVHLRVAEAAKRLKLAAPPPLSA